MQAGLAELSHRDACQATELPTDPSEMQTEMPPSEMQTDLIVMLSKIQTEMSEMQTYAIPVPMFETPTPCQSS